MKTAKKSKTLNAVSKLHHAESIIKQWLDFSELDLLFSHDVFDELGAREFAEKVADSYMRRHLIGEWSLILPSLDSNRKEATKAMHRADEFIRRKLPDAYYSATLLVLYQALCYALAEQVPDSVLRELEKRITSGMRGAENLTRDSRGAPEKWDRATLENAVKVGFSRIKKSHLLTQAKVAENITKIYKLHEPLSGNMLGKLLTNKWGKHKYKELKAERQKELEK